MDQPNPPQHARSLDRRKTIAWILLALSGGGLLLFLVVSLTERSPGGGLNALNVLVAISFAVLIASIVSLRRSYREQPGNFTGFWHLSIIDFYVVTVFAAVLMALMKAFWPENFNPVGIGMSLVVAFVFLFCILFAARHGFSSLRLKYVAALCFLCIGLGWLAVGSVLFVIIARTILGSNPSGFLETLFIGKNIYTTSHLLITKLMRIGLAVLPIGIMWLRRLRRLRDQFTYSEPR
ncbi:MAG: hypothetical protein WCT04_05610 [Planctomycetota bacterium]